MTYKFHICWLNLYFCGQSSHSSSKYVGSLKFCVLSSLKKNRPCESSYSYEPVTVSATETAFSKP